MGWIITYLGLAVPFSFPGLKWEIQTLPASEEEALHCSLTAHLQLKFQGEWSLDPLWQVYESCSTESHELSGGLLALNIYGEFWPEEWYSWYTEFCLALLFTVIYLKHFFPLSLYFSSYISLSKYIICSMNCLRIRYIQHGPWVLNTSVCFLRRGIFS